jgi:nucleoside phosphorylase
MPPRDSPAPLSPILKPGSLHFRRIFLHFFDIHFLEEKGASATGISGRAEMDLAVRFSVMLASRILVPASSYRESQLTRDTLAPFLAGKSKNLFSLVGSGSSYAEFQLEKVDQYTPGSDQHRAYSEDVEYDIAWQSRTRSSTADISSGWIKAFEERDVPRSFAGLLAAKLADEELERIWLDVPDRLGSQAFIVPYVVPLLPFQKGNLLTVNRLHSIINREYFASYGRDLEAAVFQRLVYLGGMRVPSKTPAEDIQFDLLVKACRVSGILEDIRGADPDKLDELASDPRFQNAFRGTHTAGPFERLGGTMSSKKKVDLAIVAALPKEREAIEAIFGVGKPYSVEHDPHVYKLINLEIAGREYSVAVATQSDMGNARAAVTAANMLRTFEPGLFALVGIAGGCPDPTDPDTHIRLGDVVVSTSVIEYDHVKRNADGSLDARDYPQRVGFVWIQAANALKSEVTGFSQDWLKDDAGGLAKMDTQRPDPAADVLHDHAGIEVDHPADKRRKNGSPIVHTGVIASGDTLLKDPVLRDFLRDKYKARAVEMEAIGFRDAGWAHNKETIVVRGIVDYCDMYKSNAWHLSSAVAAAAVTKLLFSTLMAAKATS